MYVAVKGGEAAIENAHTLLAEVRRGDPMVPELSVAQIREQQSLGVDRVMTEGSLYDPDLAALALKQARGDQVEAIFLLRAYRTTLPRIGVSEPINTSRMQVARRISSTFKDLPGGQLLGPTFDYTHRLLDFGLMETQAVPVPPAAGKGVLAETMPQVVDLLNAEGLIEPEIADAEAAPVGDLTREPLMFPADRALRLQNLARGDEGYLLALGYSTQRGYAKSHPFVGEIRSGNVAVELDIPELGFTVDIGDITLTECQMINQFRGSRLEPPKFTRGYGLAFGFAERKAMAMALVDRALRAEELGEDITAPAQDQEFVLSHADNVEASGFVQHLKLPHHVDFQSELTLIRTMRSEITQAGDSDFAEAAQ
ncbi:carbon-phosphorus lyase complex subunit PhnI [Ferrovibrio sp.]|uniref:carbon-phosphorus lyase complex subunit PhnI n=1 Tax=Ferrovibrio sp. TaxID=1917215 RepID=UPI001B5D76A6|nr:carbon-phosphorus lyase complex subunit PhnI [Ferrovibrio sp.]MBP7063175.1 carbon-phosphorus lyase complex subunit PhnI [Ferrovibrio sp.]